MSVIKLFCEVAENCVGFCLVTAAAAVGVSWMMLVWDGFDVVTRKVVPEK